MFQWFIYKQYLVLISLAFVADRFNINSLVLSYHRHHPWTILKEVLERADFIRKRINTGNVNV